MLWNVRQSRTGETLITSYFIKIKKILVRFKNVYLINNKNYEMRLTSSQYGLYKLGYLCATMIMTIRSNDVSQSKS